MSAFYAAKLGLSERGDVGKSQSLIRARVIVEQPSLEEKHIKEHCRFAQDKKDGIVDDWKNVVWSHETKLSCSIGQNFWIL